MKQPVARQSSQTVSIPSKELDKSIISASCRKDKEYLKMKKIKFALCKLILERFKGYTEEWFIGKGMETVKVIRDRDIGSMCALFGLDYWEMYDFFHRDYLIAL